MAAKPQPESFDPTSVPAVLHGAPEGAPTVAAPLVPVAQGGQGPTSEAVSTPSLRLFAENIGQLVQPVKDAMTHLSGMTPVAAGGFYQASAIKSNVNNGLQKDYGTILNNVAESLVDTQNAMLKLAKDYETDEEANTMKASAVTKVMDQVGTDISAIGTGGAGGAGGATGSGS
jgi:hypothetical protein